MADSGEDTPGDCAARAARRVPAGVDGRVGGAGARRRLKGDDYEHRLAWRIDDGVVVKPFYRSEDLVGLDRLIDAEPGDAAVRARRRRSLSSR